MGRPAPITDRGTPAEPPVCPILRTVLAAHARPELPLTLLAKLATPPQTP